MGTPESSDRVPELKELSFAELQKAHEETERLAATTFHETEDGFGNVLGQGVGVVWRGNCFGISVSPSLTNVHRYLLDHPKIGSQDKAEVMAAVKAMLEELGNRIIE